MSTVLEPTQSALMGREKYRANVGSGFACTAYVSDTHDQLHWDRCFDKLREIRSYEVDWNDEGAEPLRTEVLSFGFVLAKSLRSNHQPPPTRCLATDEGSIILAWEDATEYAELEIDESLCCTVRWLRPGAKRAESAVFNAYAPVF